jgi:hypothetical protein
MDMQQELVMGLGLEAVAETGFVDSPLSTTDAAGAWSLVPQATPCPAHRRRLAAVSRVWMNRALAEARRPVL